MYILDKHFEVYTNLRLHKLSEKFWKIQSYFEIVLNDYKKGYDRSGKVSKLNGESFFPSSPQNVPVNSGLILNKIILLNAFNDESWLRANAPMFDVPLFWNRWGIKQV